MTNLKNRYPHNTTATDPSSSFSSSSSLGTCLHNYDGSVMKDHRGRNIYRSQYLCSHPLMSECEEKIGYDGRQVVYMPDSCLIRNMNLIFGYDGWISEVTRERVVQSERNEDGNWVVGYIATVRLRLTGGSGGGATHEDCGTGEAKCESLTMAHEQAMKSAISEGIRRAARHFGERLGNALYVEGNALDSAPGSNAQALEGVDEYVNKCLFGKDNINAASNKDVSKIESPSVRKLSDGVTEIVTDNDDDETTMDGAIMISQDTNSNSNRIKSGDSGSTRNDCSHGGDDTPVNTIVLSDSCHNKVHSKYQLESPRPEQVARHSMALSKKQSEKKECQWSMDRPDNDSDSGEEDVTVVETMVPDRSLSETRTPIDWSTFDEQNKDTAVTGAIVGVDKHVDDVMNSDKVFKKHSKHASWSAFDSNRKGLSNLFQETSPTFDDFSESGVFSSLSSGTDESSNSSNRNNSNKFKMRSPSPAARRRLTRENRSSTKEGTPTRSNSIARSIFRR